MMEDEQGKQLQHLFQELNGLQMMLKWSEKDLNFGIHVGSSLASWK